ncbi:xanthine dehydrogenase family protein molybdopterin-binding subunit [Pseudemcibacter aquimaris]|uniref:xanthine dehydrogenase family protein molybdopterin-binding subunit n=1 Tax=Pseudemcibacter aquimaris TaxID=2857064 RepID=UPI00201318F3|nr:molybdopterin cofactor-binding domain-containing protein [Pseudemcibacter aquimaris]MCC3862006.1 molybdopterin-dependent oxidoreductase [Pseudemcibacter aquimaris]WDU58758.1 molybdopterin-dependent oxidoreductase [Pseudemcibacter aquimaris]
MNNGAQTTSRRNFLKSSFAMGALVLSCPLKTLADVTGNILPDIVEGDLGIFLKISSANIITIGSPIPDMGQGVSTAVPMLLADELDADWDQVKIEKLKPYLTMIKGRVEEKNIRQNAGGSQGIREVWLAMREAGAIARKQLLMAASKKMNVGLDELYTEKSHVIHKTDGRKIAYGDLIEEAAKIDIGDEIPPLKTADQFHIIGQEIKNEISPDIVRGVPTFGIDMKIDNMRYAMIKRSPYSEGSVQDFNRAEIENMPGIDHVTVFNRIPEDHTKARIMSAGVAIIGDSFWNVKKAYDAVDVVWNKGPNAHKSNEWLDEQFDILEKQGGHEVLYESGDVDQAFSDADQIFEATYENPYWAHVCMEPHGCIADIRDDGADIIVSHQTTARVARITHELTDIDLKNINVKMARMGTGLGRKSHRDFVYEAVLLSKEINKPVKVYWTREDEIEQDYFNPKARHILKAGLDQNGNISGMTYTLLCANNNTIASEAFPAHAIENFRASFAVAEGLQTGPWRGPMENLAGFTNQSFLDEIAVTTGQDPFEFKRNLLSGKGQAQYDTWDNLPVNHDRLLGVLELAAEKANWQVNAKKASGYGRGIACHFTFGGYAAWVVDVKIDPDGTLHILKAVGAIDCGIAVNKLGVKAQMEGGALDGFSAALNQSVDFKDGMAVSNNYDQYQMARIGELEPEIEVHFVENDHHPTGAGEIGLPPAIPALLNAIYDASGIRIRKLPIADQLKK